MKRQTPNNPQTLDELMLMAVDFAGFSLRGGRQIPPTLLAVTKREQLFFTPAALQENLGLISPLTVHHCHCCSPPPPTSKKWLIWADAIRPKLRV